MRPEPGESNVPGGTTSTSPRIYLAIPNFSASQEAQESAAAFIRELNAELFGLKHVTPIVLQPGTRLDLGRSYWRDKATGELKTVVIPLELPEMVGKGDAISLVLKHVLLRVDKGSTVDPIEEPRPRGQVYFSLIDGSGAFPPGEVHKLLEALPAEDLVLGNRQDTNWTNTKERLIIEHFEQHLLHRNFPGSYVDQWPDCQAGIWGFRLSLVDRLSITVQDYGPELALACCAARAGIKPRFIPVVTSDKRAATGFDPEKAVGKLRFLVQTLGMARSSLSAALQEYRDGDLAQPVRRKYGLPSDCSLPPEYLNGVAQLPPDIFVSTSS